MRASIRTVVILALSLGLLWLFLRHTDLRQVWTEVTRARIDLLLLSLAPDAQPLLTARDYAQPLLRAVNEALEGLETCEPATKKLNSVRLAIAVLKRVQSYFAEYEAWRRSRDMK